MASELPGVSKLSQAIESELQSGLPACQVAFARDGAILWRRSFGRCDDDTKFCLYSATKAITASAVWILIGIGALNKTKRISHYIPGFSSSGKDEVTVEQLLLHTAGLPNSLLSIEDGVDRAARIRRFSQWELEYRPGTKFQYHFNSAHWVLAELIETVSSINYRDFIDVEIMAGLHLPSAMGIRKNDHDRVASLTPVGNHKRKIHVTDLSLRSNDSFWRTAGSPANGGFATASTLSLFYQALLHNDLRLWEPQVLADGTARLLCELSDPFLNAPANRTLGLTLCGQDKMNLRRGFGRASSPSTFGHAGAHGQIAWADPMTGISFVCLTNAFDAQLIDTHRRVMRITNLAASVGR